jgi:hypothetical protein
MEGHAINAKIGPTQYGPKLLNMEVQLHKWRAKMMKMMKTTAKINFFPDIKNNC